MASQSRMDNWMAVGRAVIQDLLLERVTFLNVHAIGFCAFLTQWAVSAALDGPRVGI